MGASPTLYSRLGVDLTVSECEDASQGVPERRMRLPDAIHPLLALFLVHTGATGPNQGSLHPLSQGAAGSSLTQLVFVLQPCVRFEESTYPRLPLLDVLCCTLLAPSRRSNGTQTGTEVMTAAPHSGVSKKSRRHMRVSCWDAAAQQQQQTCLSLFRHRDVCGVAACTLTPSTILVARASATRPCGLPCRVLLLPEATHLPYWYHPFQPVLICPCFDSSHGRAAAAGVRHAALTLAGRRGEKEKREKKLRQGG